MRTRLVDVVTKYRPDALACFNWYGTTRRPSRYARPSDIFLSLDLHPQAQLTDASFQARAWAAEGIPFACQNTLFLDWWGDWGIKPGVALAQECASVLANGGRLFTGFQLRADHSLPEAAATALTDMMRFADRRIASVQGTSPVYDIAVLHPTTSYWAKKPALFNDKELADQQPLGRYQLGKPDIFPDDAPIRGAHRLLFELGYDFHIVTERTLLEHLGSYRLVVFPGVRYLTEEFIERLDKWVRSGGSLVVADEESLVSLDLRSAFDRLLGVQRTGEYPHDHAYVDDAEGPFLVRSHFMLVDTDPDVEELAGLTGIYLRGDGKPLLKTSPAGEATGRPAVTVRRVGRGEIVYYCFDPFSAYLKSNQWRIPRGIATVLERVLPKPRVRVAGSGLVEVTLRQRGGSYIVHLVNHSGYGSREWGAWGTANEVVPRSGISVTMWDPDKEVVAVADGESGLALQWWRDCDMVRMVVPTIAVHSWIEIKCNGSGSSQGSVTPPSG
jgi:hypothetical protein